MSDNGIITKRITKSITESSPLSSGAELQIQKIAAQISAQISAKVRYRIIGNPLTLIISAMALEACGSSAGAGAGVTAIVYGDSSDKEDRSISDTYIWSSGERITIYEQSVQVEDTVRLKGASIAGATFARNPVNGDQFTTAEVTLSIAGQSGVVLPYTKIADSDPASYYQGVEKVHFDTDGNGIVDADELELNLIYQRQFNNGAAVADIGTVTTTGTGFADLIIGFDIAGMTTMVGGNIIRDRVEAGAGDDYVYGLAGDDRLLGGADDDVIYGGAGNDTINGGDGNDTLYGGAGIDNLHGDDNNDNLYGAAGHDRLNGGAGNDTLYGGMGNDTLLGNADNDRFYFSEGDGDDEIREIAGEGNDTLILTGFSKNDVQSLERRDDDGVSTTGNHFKLIFTPTTVLNADGSTSMLGNSVLLKDSINGTAAAPDDTGVDAIIFDSNNNGVEDNGETVWYDEDFAGYLTSF